MTEVKSSRPYSSAVRDEQAARTRVRIVQAADDLFREQGYARTTMKQVAQRAGVARDTVHAVFGTKAALIPAIVDLRLVPDESVLNVADTPEGRAVADEPDPARQLELFADFITRLNVALRPVVEMMRGAAAAEPAVAETLAMLERNRLANMERYVGWFAAHGTLRMSKEEAARTMFAIVSPDVGRMLCDELGWSREQHASWVADVLGRALLAD
ncbi:TetR/AcrR family transcriptional regulator [Nocardioides marmoribigeumensis]|uniref:AcrR family transcriptional regulator n=1 Tax=Nocardioides marmoribigeumensis TaxID=433649 RepID=A0ABU2BTA0_9ACTN|nr:helix-turn-helix domain-containing protein [Nocardioides marmoribigeumensis]MDR7361867.1 AcrR family transcriptional regulator [Nocardioides marmoribigeumensis]